VISCKIWFKNIILRQKYTKLSNNTGKINTVTLEEQGLRDGLQSLSQTVPIEKKIEYIKALVEAGVKRLQVVSFVHPKLVPQMADAEDVIKALKLSLRGNEATEGVIFSGLVLNVKGVERAANIGLKNLAISLSASNTHSLKNARMTIEEAKAEFKTMVAVAKAANITIRGGIQCAFGCRYEGKIEEKAVYDLVKHHLDTGVDEIALADSTGMANPFQMKMMMKKVLKLAKNTPVSLHLHNTENKGYANLVAALEVGVRQFDTAFGGLGGCPFIKSATGNIATEDTAHMLHQMGFETGIDVKKVAAVSRNFQSFIGAELQGLLYKLYEKKDIKII
jgi:hydroxymethylglutaryl-CoA lyase